MPRLCVYVSLCMSVSACVCVPVHLCVWVSLCMSVSACVCVGMCLCVSVCMHVWVGCWKKCCSVFVDVIRRISLFSWFSIYIVNLFYLTALLVQCIFCQPVLFDCSLGSVYILSTCFIWLFSWFSVYFVNLTVRFDCSLGSVYILSTQLFLYCVLQAHVRCKCHINTLYKYFLIDMCSYIPNTSVSGWNYVTTKYYTLVLGQRVQLHTKYKCFWMKLCDYQIL